MPIEKEKGAIWKFSAYGFLKNQRFFAPFILLFFLSRGISYFQIGLLFGLREIYVNILEIPTGAFADVYGKKRSMILTFIFYILSFSIFYLGQTFWIFALAMLLFAFGETLRSGTHKSIIFDYLDRQNMSDQKVKVYGYTRSWSKIGSALSALIAAGLVFFKGDYGIIFLGSIVPYALDLFLMMTYPSDKESPSHRDFFSQLSKHLKETLASFKSIKNLGIGVANLSLNSAFFKMSKNYLQPILKAWALSLPLFVGLKGEKRSALTIGVVYLFIFISAAIASRKASAIKEKFGPSTQAMNIIYLINIISFLLIWIFDLTNLVIPIIFLFLALYFIRNARKPMMVGYIGDIADTSQRATVLSMENQLRSLITLIGAPILGFLADTLGVSYVFAFCGVIMLLAYSALKLKPNE